MGVMDGLDDPSLVSWAGLVPVILLVQRCGLAELVESCS